MSWDSVGKWLKSNAATGASLVGNLLTGNVPGAVAAGVAMVSSATGSADPQQALERLQADPQTMIKLRELAYQNEASIRAHIETIERLRLEDLQAEHSVTQSTIQAGDQADDRFIRWTRPGQSWVSLFFALYYVDTAENPSVEILLLLLALPWGYAGLRQIGKGVNSLAGVIGKAKGAK